MKPIVKTPLFIVSFLFVCLLFIAPSYAYVGPAIAFVSYLLGPIAAVLAAIGIVLYLPVKKLLKKKNTATDTEKKEITAENKNHES